MKKFSVYFIIVLCIVSSVFISVSASPIDSNGNRFVDFNDYAEYGFSDDGTTVNVDVSFPSMWNNTFIDQRNPEFHPHWFWGNEFTIDDSVMPWLKINMHPLGGEMGWNTGVGEQLFDCYFIDLQYFPAKTVFRYNFTLSVGQADLNLDEQVYTRYFFFVDSAGKVVDVGIHYFNPIRDGLGNFTWTEQIRIDTFPKNAVGFVPMFVARNTGWASGDVTVKLSSFEFSFPMSALQYTDQQNKQIQSTLNSIQSAMDEQNKVFDEIVNGTVDSQKPIDSNDFDDLKDIENDLMGNVENYLDDGIGFFDNAVGVVIGVANGFQAIKVLTAPVFNLPFANDIILVSVSLGLIGTLLGVVSMASSSIGKRQNSDKVKNKGKKGG